MFSRKIKIFPRTSCFYLVMSLLLFLLIITSCTPVEKECKVDSDCVPDSCCHAKGVVNKLNAPDCKGIVCTAECQPDTLDCGQGDIKCISGKCGVMN